MGKIKVPFYIQSINGHDEKLVEEKEVKHEINNLLSQGNWVNVEKKDGTQDIITNKKELDEKIVEEETEDDAEEEETEEIAATVDNAITGKDEIEKKEGDWKNAFGLGNKPSNIKSVQATKPLKGG